MVKMNIKGSGILFSAYPVTGLKTDGPSIRKNLRAETIKLAEWTKAILDFDGVDIPEAKIIILFNKGEFFVDDLKLYEVK